MKPAKLLRIKIDDANHLSTLFDATFPRGVVAAILCGIFIVMLLIAGVIIMVTPIHNLLPGYLREDQRSASEMNLMRLDSLIEASNRNQAYINNIMHVLDTDRTAVIQTDSGAVTQAIDIDSLLPTSEAEKRFMKTMEDRERFNISILAPLAADGLMFYPPSDNAVFTSDSRDSQKAVIILPDTSPAACVADGTIISSYYSPSERGYVVVIQHRRGFVTRYSHLGAPIVSPGDIINAGQAVANVPAPNSKGARTINIEMWHDGLPIIPYRYIGTGAPAHVADKPYEAPRGR